MDSSLNTVNNVTNAEPDSVTESVTESAPAFDSSSELDPEVEAIPVSIEPEPEPEPEPALPSEPEAEAEGESIIPPTSITTEVTHPIVLNVYINEQYPELRNTYIDHIQKHNTHVETDPYPNSGFDLFVPHEFWCSPDKTSVMVNHQIKCEMVEDGHACGFFSFPRSSISKTPLILANHTGIIDSGYRGYLFGAFRTLGNRTHKTEAGVRLLQICHPSLKPFKVRFIMNECELSTTSRGSGGFGSTGK